MAEACDCAADRTRTYTRLLSLDPKSSASTSSATAAAAWISTDPSARFYALFIMKNNARSGWLITTSGTDLLHQ
jgi:hypothetical protein